MKQNEIVRHKEYAELITTSKKFGSKKVKIDLDDIEKCKQYHWYARKDHSCKTKEVFYIGTTKNNSCVLLHRFITNCPKDMVIDHINHNTLDNRKTNLKICTTFENMQNRTTKSGEQAGVRFDKRINKWRADIKINQKLIFIGNFENYQDAVNARLNTEKQLLHN